MTRIKKLCALVLAVMMVVTAGVISVNAAQSSDSDAVSADTTETGITIHVRMSDGTQPYVYSVSYTHIRAHETPEHLV